MTYIGAEWCRPCLELKPHVATLEDDFENLSVRLYDFDTDQAQFSTLVRDAFNGTNIYLPMVVLQKGSKVIAASDQPSKDWIYNELDKATTDSETVDPRTSTQPQSTSLRKRSWMERNGWIIPTALVVALFIWLANKK